MGMIEWRARRACGGTVLLFLSLLVGIAASPARAQEADALYQAVAIVTGTDMRSRSDGCAYRCR